MKKQNELIPVFHPAYGRFYTCKAEVLRDFFLGKDFVLELPKHQLNNRYVSLRNLEPGDKIVLTFQGKTKKTTLVVTQDHLDNLEPTLENN